MNSTALYGTELKMQQANPTGSLWLHSAIILSLYQKWKGDWWGILELQIQATDANMQCILSLSGELDIHKDVT